MAVTATLATGVVGAVRQRSERDAVRAGTRTRATAASLTVAPTRQGAVAAAVSEWTPPVPRTATGRVISTVWASPMTAVGLALALTTGGRPRWDTEHQCLVFEGARGGSARFLRAVGAGANAIGHVVVSTYPATPALVLAHEAGHVRQAERLGPVLFPLYLWWSARYGYRDNPIERGARAAARRWVRSRRESGSD